MSAARRVEPGLTSSAGFWKTIAPVTRLGRRNWHTMSSAWQSTGKRSRNRTVRSIPSPGHWITCTVPLKTLTPCPSRNPGVCLSSGTWNTGTAALAVRICRESRFTDSLPRHFPARGTGAALAAVSLHPHGSACGSRDASLVASGARPVPRRGTRTAVDPDVQP